MVFGFLFGKKKKKVSSRKPKAKKLKLKKSPPKKTIRPVKKAKAKEELIGKITHFFPHVSAGVIKISKGTLSVGDAVHIKGATSDFTQAINSLQINNKPIEKVSKPKEAGFLAKQRVRRKDKVYKIKGAL